MQTKRESQKKKLVMELEEFHLRKRMGHAHTGGVSFD
jgi:hypothetical protein